MTCISVVFADDKNAPDIKMIPKRWDEYLGGEQTVTNSNIYFNVGKLFKDLDEKGKEKPAGTYHYKLFHNGDLIEVFPILNGPQEIEKKYILGDSFSEDEKNHYYEFTIGELIDKSGSDSSIVYDQTPITVEIYTFYDHSAGERKYAVYYKKNDQYVLPAFFENEFHSENKEDAEIIHRQEKYDEGFFFTKKWSSVPTDNVSFTLYRADGTEANKDYLKKTIKQGNTWNIEYWLQTDPTGYYVVETGADGYVPVYQNLDSHKDFKDRIYDGGTILNVRIPTTGDHDLPNILFMLSALGLTGVLVCIIVRKAKV